MKKLMACLLAVMLVFAGAAHAFDFDDMLGGLTSMFSPDADESYGAKEIVEIGDISIELTNVLESGKNEFYTPEDGYEYIIIEFSIENNGKEDLTVSSMLCFSAWCDGKMYTISLEALSTAMFAGKPQMDTIIEPGKSFTGVIGYEVPEDWEEMIVEFKEDIIGKTISFAVQNEA